MLKQAKKNTNLKGYELALFLGVAEATIYNWEKNDAWPSWALKMVGILKVD